MENLTLVKSWEPPYRRFGFIKTVFNCRAALNTAFLTKYLNLGFHALKRVLNRSLDSLPIWTSPPHCVQGNARSYLANSHHRFSHYRNVSYFRYVLDKYQSSYNCNNCRVLSRCNQTSRFHTKTQFLFVF